MTDQREGAAARDCEMLLLQGRSVVKGLSDRHYAAKPEPIDGASAGAHLRHVLDYFDCLFSGVDAGAVDYTIRRRSIDVEHAVTAGLRELDRCVEALGKLEGRRDRSRIDVRCDEGEPWVASTLERELRFVASHAVHHFALIRLTLTRFGVETPPDFGVSPSTLAHRAGQG